MSSKIAIFYHVYQGGNWERLYHEQICKLQQSGLYDEASHIHIGINGDLPMPFDLVKVNHVKRNENIGSEADTLYDLWRFCKTHPDWKVLYMHTKGASKHNSYLEEAVEHWRIYLEHFSILKWKSCQKRLENHDCVGAEWQENTYFGPSLLGIPHYSGNFWWANASYINKLDPDFLNEVRYGRFACEFWIGTKSPNHFNFYTDGPLTKYLNPVTPDHYEHIEV